MPENATIIKKTLFDSFYSTIGIKEFADEQIDYLQTNVLDVGSSFYPLLKFTTTGKGWLTITPKTFIKKEEENNDDEDDEKKKKQKIENGEDDDEKKKKQKIENKENNDNNNNNNNNNEKDENEESIEGKEITCGCVHYNKAKKEMKILDTEESKNK